MSPTEPSPSENVTSAPIAEVKLSAPVVRSLFGRRISWLWLVTAAALVVAVVLVVLSWQARGPRIMVRFEHGRSIEPGDRLRHRGIEVGEVTSVTLDQDLGGVRIEIALDADASALARAGSRFWIERPQVSLTRVSGLETIVGGQYLAVLPGPADAKRQITFDGLESPPVGELAPGGIEVVLEADRLGGLQPRAPISYRGVQVGRILAVGLATDAASVTAHAFIEPAYTQLIRDNTQFWRRSGLDVSLGIRGVEFDVESLSSVAMGGVSLATADPPGRTVKTGHTFVLHDEPEDEWLAWKPRVPVGSDLLPAGLSLPRPVRASVRWSERTFGFKRDKMQQGWVLPLADGRLVGPSDVLAPNLPEDTAPTLEVAGQEMPLAPSASAPVEGAGQGTETLIFLDADVELDMVDAWPAARLRSPDEPEDCLIVGATDASVVPASASRFTPENGKWRIDPTLPVNAVEHHGACVISIRDGSLIGLALVDERGAAVALMTEKILER